MVAGRTQLKDLTQQQCISLISSMGCSIDLQYAASSLPPRTAFDGVLFSIFSSKQSLSEAGIIAPNMLTLDILWHKLVQYKADGVPIEDLQEKTQLVTSKTGGADEDIEFKYDEMESDVECSTDVSTYSPPSTPDGGVVPVVAVDIQPPLTAILHRTAATIRDNDFTVNRGISHIDDESDDEDANAILSLRKSSRTTGPATLQEPEIFTTPPSLRSRQEAYTKFLVAAFKSKKSSKFSDPCVRIRTGHDFCLALSDNPELNIHGYNSADKLHGGTEFKISPDITNKDRPSLITRAQENSAFDNTVDCKFSHVTAKYFLTPSKRDIVVKKVNFKNATDSLTLEKVLRPHKRQFTPSFAVERGNSQSVIGSRRVDFDSFLFCRYSGARIAYLSLRRQFGGSTELEGSMQSELAVLLRLLLSRFPALIQLQEAVRLANEDTLRSDDNIGRLSVLVELLEYSQTSSCPPREGIFIPRTTKDRPLRVYSLKVNQYFIS